MIKGERSPLKDQEERDARIAAIGGEARVSLPSSRSSKDRSWTHPSRRLCNSISSARSRRLICLWKRSLRNSSRASFSKACAFPRSLPIQPAKHTWTSVLEIVWTESQNCSMTPRAARSCGPGSGRARCITPSPERRIWTRFPNLATCFHGAWRSCAREARGLRSPISRSFNSFASRLLFDLLSCTTTSASSA